MVNEYDGEETNIQTRAQWDGWEDLRTGDLFLVCSNCGCPVHKVFKLAWMEPSVDPYCPECHARMTMGTLEER